MSEETKVWTKSIDIKTYTPEVGMETVRIPIQSTLKPPEGFKMDPDRGACILEILRRIQP